MSDHEFKHIGLTEGKRSKGGQNPNNTSDKRPEPPQGSGGKSCCNKPVMLGDVIGGFPVVDPNCAGCGKPLTIENAWMTDGCPCNYPLGVNSMNETRWRLLMQLQQKQSHMLERWRSAFRQIETRLHDYGLQFDVTPNSQGG